MFYCVFVTLLLYGGRTGAEIFDPSYNRTAYVEMLCKERYIQTKEVKEIILTVARESFYPPQRVPDVYTPIDLGYNATFSPVQMHCFALENLKDHLKQGNRVLDVGSGTGYMTVCMALMVGRAGFAVGIEHIPELVYDATSYVRKEFPSLLLEDRVKYISDGRLGYPELGPYDAIHIGAVTQEVPTFLVKQLSLGGRLVVLVHKMLPNKTRVENFVMVDRYRNGSFGKTTITRCNILSRGEPLGDKDKQYLLEQLKEGGRLVMPMNRVFANRTLLQELIVVDKHLNGTVTETVMKELFIVCKCEPLGDRDAQFPSVIPTHQTY